MNGQTNLSVDSLKGLDTASVGPSIIKIGEKDSTKVSLARVKLSDTALFQSRENELILNKGHEDTMTTIVESNFDTLTINARQLLEEKSYLNKGDSISRFTKNLVEDSLKQVEMSARKLPSSSISQPEKKETSYLKQLNLRRGIVVDSSYLETLFQRDGLVDMYSIDSLILVDLRYADTNNFMHINIYDGLQRAYLSCETAWRLAAAQYYLNKLCVGCRIVVLDATRPLHIQQMMWDSLKMKEGLKHFFLASPDSRSLHNYGRAVDVTIVDSLGWTLDMGTDFDAFVAKSAPEYESVFIEKGLLSEAQIKNRILLRRVMRLAGFRSIKSEWWHFNLGTIQEARQKHPVIK